MKKLNIILIALMLFALTACGGKSKEYDLNAVSEELKDSGCFSDILSEVDTATAAMVYGFDASKVVEGKIYLSTGATTEEIGLFKCKDEDSAKEILGLAKARGEAQATAYVSYAPLEPAKIDDGIIKQEGVYVFYVIANDSSLIDDIL